MLLSTHSVTTEKRPQGDINSHRTKLEHALHLLGTFKRHPNKIG